MRTYAATPERPRLTASEVVMVAANGRAQAETYTAEATSSDHTSVAERIAAMPYITPP